jgi:hypothetical protein
VRQLETEVWALIAGLTDADDYFSREDLGV